MVGDIRLITPDDNEGGITDGEIPIFDMDGFSLRHITRVVLSTLRCYMKYTQVRYISTINFMREIQMKRVFHSIKTISLSMHLNYFIQLNFLHVEKYIFL